MAAAGNYFNPFTPLGGDRGDRDAMPEFGNEVVTNVHIASLSSLFLGQSNVPRGSL